MHKITFDRQAGRQNYTINVNSNLKPSIKQGADSPVLLEVFDAL